MVELRLLSMADLGVKDILESYLTKADNDYYSNDGEMKSKINTLKKSITLEKEFIRKKTEAAFNESLITEIENDGKNTIINHKYNNNSFNDYYKDIQSKKKKAYNKLFNENYKEFVRDSFIYQNNPLKDLQPFDNLDKKIHQTHIGKIISFKSQNERLSKGSTFSYSSEKLKPNGENIFENTHSIPIIQMTENGEPEDLRNIIHINKNNYEDIDNIVTQMRKTILYSKKNPIKKEIIDFNDLTSSSDSSDRVNTIIKQNESNLNNEIKNKNESSQNINYINNEIMNDNETQEQKEKQFRHLLKKLDLVYDTDSEEEDMDLKVQSFFSQLYILPNSNTKILFDAILLFFVIYTMFQIPYILAFPEYNENKNKMKRNISVDIIIDLYFIFDIIVCCITAYTDIIEEKLIISFTKIFQHYLNQYFILDILSAIPINTILGFHDINFIGKYKVYTHYFSFIYLLKLLRLIKCFKVLLYNSFLNYSIKMLNKITGSLYMEKYYRTFLSIYITFYSFHLFGCVFIFFGKSNSPNWIIQQGLDIKNDLEIYVAAVYFVCATVFSVGYGDIVSFNYYERFFNVIMLILGMLIYTWMISSISNYFMDNDVDLIKYKKNISLLEEIRIKHDNFSDDLYQKIRRFLLYKRENHYMNYNNIYDNLPVIMRNTLIFEMYKPIIENFVFFKNFDDHDFILKVILCLKPFNAIKGERLVNDGDFIDEIIFVKNGCLSVEFPLPFVLNQSKKNMSGKSLSNYSIGEKNKGKKKYLSLKNFKFGKAGNFIRKIIKKPKKKKLNKPHIKLIEIRKNEHFGDIIMFLNKRSPLSLKVKSRKAELLFLMKTDAIEISVGFPKIWKKILKNSLYNMQQIDILIEKYLQIFYINYKKTFIETIPLVKQKTGEERENKNKEIDQFYEIRRKSQILIEPPNKSFCETSRTKSNDISSNTFEISFKASKSYKNSKIDNSLIEFESDDDNKNDSPEEIEIEYDKINTENNKENKKDMLNFNLFNNNINDEFKRNEIILKTNFLFKRIKNKFSNLQIIHNDNFTMPIIENKDIINENELIILGKNKIVSPPLRYRIISPKINNYKNKLSIINENKNKNKSSSNQNNVTINKNEFTPLSAEEIEKNTKKIHKNATMNTKKQKDFYLEFNKPKVTKRKASTNNFFETKNKTNIITKKKSNLKKKNTFSIVNNDKEKKVNFRRKSFFIPQSKGIENTFNNQRNKRKSQWNIINDNIKENGQNLKNPELFYSAIFSKMMNQKDKDDDN